MIDPRRKQQNNERAADLLEFMRKINRLDTDTEEWKRLSAELSTLVAKNWSLPAHSESSSCSTSIPLSCLTQRLTFGSTPRSERVALNL